MKFGRITKGIYKGAMVQPADTMECPRFGGANGETITICVIIADGEYGLIVALKDNEVRWV